MRLIKLICSLSLLLLASVPAAHATAFTPGNLVVVRFGDGSAALASSGTAVFLDEYTTAGALVQTVALPTANSGANKSLVASGTATSEGQLTRSTDGKYLVLPGYNSSVGTASLTSSASTAVNRVVALVDAAGSIDTTTALTNYSTGSNPRSAAYDGTNLWLTGGAGGVVTATKGATTATTVSTTVTNIRNIGIFGGQLYVTSGSGAFRLAAVGTGLPITTGQTITNLPGYATSGGSPYGFFFADLGAGVDGFDTVYVTDSSANSVTKYCLVSGSWTASGSIAGMTGASGLTGMVSGTTVTLYVAGPGAIYKITDASGYNVALSGSAASLGSTTANTAFRGIALAPENPVTLPAVTSTTPANSASAVAVNTAVTVTFNQAVTVSAGGFALSSTFNGATAATVATTDNLTFTLTPSASFTLNDTLTATVRAANVRDQATGLLSPAADYVFSFTTATAAAQTITFAQPAAHLSTDAPFTLVATASSGLTVTFAVDSGPATVSGSTLTLTGTAGSVVVRASQAGNGSYLAAPDVTRTIAVTAAAAAQTITFAQPAQHYTTDAPFTLSATASSGLSVTFSLVSGPATINGSTLTLTGTAGSVVVMAAQAGNASYLAAADVTRTIAVVLPLPTHSFARGTYTQNFDTLPSTGTFTFSGNGPFALSGATPPDGVGATGMTGWSFVNYGGTGLNALITVGTGSGTAGSVYSFGSAAASDRALGSVASAAQVGRFGLTLVNTTGTTLTQFTLGYTGEQWRNGGNATAQVLGFSYAVGATDLNTGTFTNATALDFTSPIATASAATLDGNAAANRTVIAPVTITGLSWAPGATLVLRWTDLNDSGNDHGLAVDDLTFAAPIAQSIAFAQPAGHFTTDAPFALTATATSGLPVTLTVVSGPAALSGGTLTLNGTAGTIVVRAAQTGSSAYFPAADVIRTITITARGPQVYLGTFSGSGGFGVNLAPDGQDSTLIGFVAGSSQPLVLNFRVNPDGTFTSATKAAAAERYIPAGRSAADTGFTLQGHISAGVLTATIVELNLDFSATLQPDTGTASGVAGFYQAQSLNSVSGSVYSVVSAAGNAFVLVVTPGYVGGGSGTVGANGAFSIGTTQSGVLSGTISPVTTGITGTLALPGQVAQSFGGLAAGTPRTDRLVNLSTRAFNSPTAGTSTLIAGFVIGGTLPKSVLLRAVGPGLLSHGVTSAAADPHLRLYNSAGSLITENNDWGGGSTLTDLFRRLGATPLAPASKDAAVTSILMPGAYTIHVTVNGSPGVTLAEVYDASVDPANETQRLLNVSTRGPVASGENLLISGFVVAGNSPKRVLIRGVGPGLADLGVTGALADPVLRVYSGSTVIAQNDNWETPQRLGAQSAASAAELAEAAAAAGAFAFATGSRDAAVILTLAPGVYTAQVSGGAGATGIALAEVYEIPQ